ncbi:kinase-like domain-containing protein [Gigaspora rosea]|uniref:Kinase-like domain-containing protein n=1 Tax=Gigaspora rosea TaxID=44941 RepID=A0A397VGR5_9GLOM|nr:kinase-like domain-containing protein [Gigaspora rosea]
MTFSSHEQLEKTIADKHIICFDPSKFSNFEKIAEGGFGSIYKSEWKDCGLTVALKRFKVDTNSSENAVQKVAKELRLLQGLGFHPNINRFYGVIKDSPDGAYDLVLEFADDGDLREYLKSKFLHLNWTDKLRMAKEVTQGVVFLHMNNIIHGDLHSKNILVHRGNMMITDFGLSRHMNETSSADQINFGMPAYLEPQSLKNPFYVHNKKSDIYSLGVIFWEISSGRPPFQSFTTKEAIAIHIFNGKRENPIEGTPSKYIELYSQCWDEDPDKRSDAYVILKDLNRLISSFSDS